MTALRNTDIDLESLNLSYVAKGPNSITSKTWGSLADAVKEMHTSGKITLEEITSDMMMSWP